LNECKGRISTAKALANSKTDEVNNALQKVSELISGNWQIDWMDSPNEFASTLTHSATEYTSCLQKKQTLSSQLETVKANVANIQDVMSTILSAMPSWTEVKAGDVVNVENLLTKANALNTSVATALSKLKTAEEHLEANQTKLYRFLAEHSSLSMERLETLNTYTANDITRENESLKNARETVVARKTLLDNAEKLFAEHQAKKPEFAEDDTLDVLNGRIEGIEKQLAEISEKRGAINQELKTDKDNRNLLGALIQETNGKKAIYDKWSRLNQLIGSAKGDLFRKIAQSYVLTSLIHSANSYMKTLTDRYTLKVSPGTFVISLEDAYQGFVSRAASTISGGESFLVSLSLALAMSDIGQQ
jgi:exonuclease SbcC